jgi:hypothetical protein
MRSYLEYVHAIQTKNYSLFKKNNIHQKSCDEFKEKLIDDNELQREILTESNEVVLEYISNHLDLSKYFKNILFSTRDKTYADSLDFSDVRAIINFCPLNEITELNEHMISVNKLLPDEGVFIGRVETYGERKIRIFKKFGTRFGQLLWLVDFILNRVIPKLRLFGIIYNLSIKNKTHLLSKAETLGRLVYCGFEIIDYSIIDNLFYFVVKKIHEPSNETEPSCHLFMRLKRIGKGGKLIQIYKLRTMHCYSEYLQGYVVRLYEYDDAGKPADDFRISRWGKLLRKHWIDEIPQLFNVFKGEMKLFGVRPVSRERFQEFPKDLQIERIKFKPGWFPPYVALLKPDQYGNIEAERIYLKEFAQHPIITDIKYFFKSILNIALNKIRSH